MKGLGLLLLFDVLGFFFFNGCGFMENAVETIGNWVGVGGMI